MAALFTEHTETCDTCAGEGRYVVFGKTNNPYATTPPEHLVECEECHGEGVVERDRCTRCGLVTEDGDWGVPGQYPWDRCCCGEDLLTVWERGPHLPEVTAATIDVADYLRLRPASAHQSEASRKQAAWVGRIRSAAACLAEVQQPNAATRLLIEALRREADALDYPVLSETEEVFA
jgi:hypothetical protein